MMIILRRQPQLPPRKTRVLPPWGRLESHACMHGCMRYVGSTHDITKRMERNLHNVNNLHSPLYRHLQEHGIEGWEIHEYVAVHYDQTRCPDALRRAEDDAIRQLRSNGCQLLNKNAALRTNSHGVAQKAWREAHGQGTPDSYMAAYCREWRARKPAREGGHVCACARVRARARALPALPLPR